LREGHRIDVATVEQRLPGLYLKRPRRKITMASLNAELMRRLPVYVGRSARTDILEHRRAE
jgi:hypothetical protein